MRGLAILCAAMALAGLGLETESAAAKSQKQTTELVAMVPNNGSNNTIEWVEIKYPAAAHGGASSAADVVATTVLGSSDEGAGPLGAWQSAAPSGGASLSAKVFGPNLYALVNTDGATSEQGGCCASAMEIFPRSSSEGPQSHGPTSTTVNLQTAVQTALNTTTAEATHTFAMTKMRGNRTVALVDTVYQEESLGLNVYVSAIVAVDMATGDVVPTATGELCFKPFDVLGSVDDNASPFEIQYYTTTSSAFTEQHHMNGVVRIRSRTYGRLLAFTHRILNEVVVVTDPWASPAPPSIVQRFGSPATDPSDRSSSYRFFGLPQDTVDNFSGVHNVWYDSSSASFNGKESLTIFVNDQGGASQGVEFVLSPVSAVTESASAVTDAIFEVDFVQAEAPFQADAQGGARPLGNGVFLFTTGVASPRALVVADVNGASFWLANATNTDSQLYDPFCRLKLKPSHRDGRKSSRGDQGSN